MRKRHDAESSRATERHVKAAAAPLTVDTDTRRRGVRGVLNLCMAVVVWS